MKAARVMTPCDYQEKLKGGEKGPVCSARRIYTGIHRGKEWAEGGGWSGVVLHCPEGHETTDKLAIQVQL